jgi:zinc D-Ala-D-Ala carboxypeptidase
MDNDILLSEHFHLSEFRHGGAIPDSCIPVFIELAAKVLEPVRTEFSKPLEITSGYRSEEENKQAHGQSNSEHMATSIFCAADFYIEGIGMRFCFDWMRNNPTLPYHQLILESDQSGISIIHVSLNKMMPGTRSVLIGQTHNQAPYQHVDYVAYVSVEKQPKSV